MTLSVQYFNVAILFAQMAGPASFITMSDLLEESAETEEDDVLLDKIKAIAQQSLPDGWTNWKTLNPSKEELFGEAMDPQILNKIRFALPTLEYVRTFYPDADYIAEKPFREIKVSMLRWSLCRALIISPPCIVNKIKGTAAQAEIFINAIQPMRHAILTRMDVCRQLGRESEGDDHQEEVPAKRCRLDKLEEKVDNLFELIHQKVGLLKNLNTPRQRPTSVNSEWSVRDVGEASSGSDVENIDPYGDNSEGASDIDTGTAFHVPELELKDNWPNSVQTKDISFAPEVREDGPLIPAPSESIRCQGVACQKLGSTSWNKIRYKEVQKKLRVTPVFDALKVNDQLGHMVPKNFSTDLLSNADTTLGTICHGLLKQREVLVDQFKLLGAKYPEILEDIQQSLSSVNSPLKNISDDLLHYTCARRAEIIELRRKAFKASNEFLTMKLAKIPPSETHLFEENHLEEFINKQGGFFRVFRSIKKPLHQSSSGGQHRQNKSDYKQRSKQSDWKKPQASTSTSGSRPKQSKEKPKASKKPQPHKKKY